MYLGMKTKIDSITTTIKNYVWTIRMKLYIRKANELRKKTGIQQFIVINRGKVTIINKQWFKQNRNKFPKNFTADNLKKIAYYYTSK